MAFTIRRTAEFKEWFDQQDKSLRRAMLAHIETLRERGPYLGRPQADTLKGSKLKNLKELRVQYRGDPYRILYAFDPKREALLLVGGNKTEDKKWYDKMIPRAEKLFQAHLDSLDKEDAQ